MNCSILSGAGCVRTNELCECLYYVVLLHVLVKTFKCAEATSVASVASVASVVIAARIRVYNIALKHEKGVYPCIISVTVIMLCEFTGLKLVHESFVERT